jgi:hypothetical protein
VFISQEHRSFPSIITWVVFNEGWGQYETERVVKLAKSLDSSRLVNPASGWVDAPVGSSAPKTLIVHFPSMGSVECLIFVQGRLPYDVWAKAHG